MNRLSFGQNVENQKAIGGVLITLDKPPKPKRDEGASARRFESELWQMSYPKIEIVTIEGLLTALNALTPRASSTHLPWLREKQRRIS
jgi:hypothetical protein